MNPSLAGFVLVVILLLGAVFGYGWWYQVVAKESATAATLAASITEKNDMKNRIAAERETLANLSNNETTAGAYFVSEDNIVSFLAYLQSLGRESGTTLNILSVSSPPSKSHAALSVSLEISGSFDAVVHTLGAIEYAPYAISVQNLSISKSSESPKGAPPWSATLTLSVASPPSVASTLPAPSHPVSP